MENQIKTEYFEVPVFGNYQEVPPETSKRKTFKRSSTPIEDTDTETTHCTRPSEGQLNLLLTFIEKNKWFGRSRNKIAGRHRSRAAWQDISVKLNKANNGEGCFKTTAQWAKYWCDKKAQLQRKLFLKETQITAFEDDSVMFSESEKRILAVMKPTDSQEKRQIHLDLVTSVPFSTAKRRPPTYRNTRHRKQASELTTSIVKNEFEEICMTGPYLKNSDFDLLERLQKLEDKRTEIKDIEAKTRDKLNIIVNNMTEMLTKQSENIEKTLESTNEIIMGFGGGTF